MSHVETAITLRWNITKRCPFRDELDAGQLEIRIPEEAPELHNLAAEIWELLAEPVTHEDFTRGVATLLQPGSQVVTTWNTGPFAVTVEAVALENGEAEVT